MDNLNLKKPQVSLQPLPSATFQAFQAPNYNQSYPGVSLFNSNIFYIKEEFDIKTLDKSIKD